MGTYSRDDAMLFDELLLNGILFVVFLATGYVVDITDYVFDRLRKKLGGALFGVFIITVTLASFLSLLFFPSQFLGIVLGLLISKKLDKPIFLVIAVLLFYVFVEPVDMRLLLLFGAASFFDEQSYFREIGRPVVKLAAIVYAVVSGDVLFLSAMAGFDLGYDIATKELEKRKGIAPSLLP
ncbi:MAG: hypothetical protein D6769_02955 [Methanobacteriota archaeon]|nr:MAG: hypothetical protein D6769_02955 [Euryarchaeota archaeon]